MKQAGFTAITMSYVFVLDTNKQPLNPVHPGWARKLLSKGRAAVYKRYPFTIILKKKDAEVQPLRLKIDPGSKTTGLAIVNDNTGDVLFAAELNHRGLKIKKSMDSRRAIRRGRRNRNTSDPSQAQDKPRFKNRRREEGWLPPSLSSRVENIATWIARLQKLSMITAISLELVKFDTQAMQNPEITGVEYQQGELQGYEVREYLLEKFGRKCVYCGAENIPLQIEHIVPGARGGNNRVSNLTLACESCNRKKGTKTAEEFGHPKVQILAKKPLSDAAAVNTIRWALYRRIKATGLPVETGTGGRTKYNRIVRGLPKTHWLDAAFVGAKTPELLKVEGIRPLVITAMGHGSRQICSLRSVVYFVNHSHG
jgi:5-methylcytosine-specific restriction endonuclease McrA